MKTYLIIALGLLLSMPSFSQKKVHKARHAQKVAHKKHVVRKHKYRHLPKRGVVVATRPAGCVAVRHGKLTYHVHNGVWYKPHAKGYVVCRPGRGARVHFLPVGHRRLLVGKSVFFYYNGVYYRQMGKDYEVVDPPLGAQVESLPEDAEEYFENGVTKYKVDENIYVYNDEYDLFVLEK